ncbi:hypothetical protein NF556_01795 [Ornithinimicrobium faecis]|uniref:HTH cro/C1-type domain-containing protein n=1 Tax=Ornithinimicrobium faecis TaxID=2934158 RepID=A0ABY4YUJ9_9MICO|nr:hypothetical protein [Ornithinimicrobium sp. HY1793]USQ80425.1 hypothetical protein NF556_01795 [Ornithinimicrobium sp. HY1793]
MEKVPSPHPAQRQGRRTGRTRTAEPPPTPSVQEQVGLALRADRRQREQSQRAYAAERDLSRDTLARVEVDASGMRLDAAIAFLEGTGYELVVQPVSSDGPDPWWDLTDVAARTRAGGRFPAHRKVKETPWGPLWWDYHERIGNRGFGPKPKWSAEGFTPPPGTRYGKIPTPAEDGGPRWPYTTRFERRLTDDTD